MDIEYHRLAWHLCNDKIVVWSWHLHTKYRWEFFSCALCSCFNKGLPTGFSVASGFLSSKDISQNYSATISFISDPSVTSSQLRPRILTGRLVIARNRNEYFTRNNCHNGVYCWNMSCFKIKAVSISDFHKVFENLLATSHAYELIIWCLLASKQKVYSYHVKGSWSSVVHTWCITALGKTVCLKNYTENETVLCHYSEFHTQSAVIRQEKDLFAVWWLHSGYETPSNGIRRSCSKLRVMA